ncbi:hypothetical protein NIES4073_37200 [Kalymmatonema gypsitolerans NIES-4073]|nr:hypothetical protein NIES4073_37200 [Scytonema sp. NIES-4073]
MQQSQIGREHYAFYINRPTPKAHAQRALDTLDKAAVRQRCTPGFPTEATA